MSGKHSEVIRGLMSAKRSPLFQGRFGRMFRSLPPATFGHTESENENNLKLLGAAMSASFDPVKDGKDDEESGIPALYTYFGQFIDHDVTFDPASSLQQQNDPDALVDFRTPALDLDNVYGRGPDDQPYMYNGTWAIDQWSKIGVQVTQRVVPTGPWFAALRNKNEFSVGLAGNCNAIVNPAADVSTYLPASVNSRNYGYYEDPQLLDTYNKMLRETDLEQQKGLMFQYVKRLQDEEAHIAFLLWCLKPTSSSETAIAMYSPSESQRRWFSSWSCCTCLGAEPPAPVSNMAPPAISGTIDSILALVPSSMIGNRSVR